MTAVAHAKQPLCGQKRRRSATEATIATSQFPCEKAKSYCQSRRETNTAYWDSLSKLRLTRLALNELNRRNREGYGLVRPTGVRVLDPGNEPNQLKNSSQQLKRFARHGGPDLRDVGGVSLTRDTLRLLLILTLQHPDPSASNLATHFMPSRQSSSRTHSKTTTSKTKKTSPYDPNFEQNLIDNHIYPSHYDFPGDRVAPNPDNWKDINERLKESRLSLSPSCFTGEEFDTFVRTNSRALNEDAVMGDVFPVIQGTARIPSAKNLIFGNLEPLTRGNLVDAKPDFYDGAHPAQIDLRIREELGSYIIPATQGHAPALPNVFTEAKGPDGSAAVAKRQACFDGALGARGVHKLQLFEADHALAYDNNAYTITSTYHDGQLKMYTVHPSQSVDPEISPEFHMTQLGGWALTGSYEQFRQGVSAFRNARDWARTQRDGLITAANGRATGMLKETSTLEPSIHSTSQLSIEPITLDSETSADELSEEVGQGSRLSYKRLKSEPERRSSDPDLKLRPKKSCSGAYSRSRSRGRRSQRK